ncbi:MAG TPA: tetratricopeptide repeat protein, partial [Gemmatimonadales bacterium]|nr:tetratricopeptide repeat protein [Gemmatimonadales bacterium]
MYTSEIEKLEKRWAENPKGRNFAPLADAYRKAGELDRAIELCQAGLERHPDYVSAHIVYGRCLIDRKNDAGAAEVFQKVLGLDPENVLGLKMLAEIAERGGRHDETVEWLSRLLNADPMNGDAAEALARARGRAAQAPNAKTVVPLSPPGAPRAAGAPAAAAATTVRAPARPGPNAPAAPGGAPARPGAPARSAAASPPPPVARLVPEAKTAPLPKPDFVVEHESEERENPELKAIGSPQDLETFDGTIDFNTAAHGSARADGLEVHEEIELKPQNLIVEGLAHTQYESIAPPPAPEAAEPEEDIGTIDLPLIMPDDVTPAHVAAPSPRAEWASPPPPPPPPAPPPAAVALSDDDGAADTTALSQAEPVLTETMAELYMRQGHQEDALRVYQALLAERPGDARLRARVQALSPGGKHAPAWTSGESLPTFLRRILAGQPRAQALEAPEPPPPPRPPPPAPAPPSPPASRGVDPVGQSPLDHAFGITAHHPE